jgi:hypothetical protein
MLGMGQYVVKGGGVGDFFFGVQRGFFKDVFIEWHEEGREVWLFVKGGGDGPRRFKICKIIRKISLIFFKDR